MFHITKGSIESRQLNVPTLPEQTKIANFLTAVDAKITNLSEEKSLLENYKKGVMQKIFSQELRFKQDDGSDFPEWEKRKLSHFLEVSNLKNGDLKFDGRQRYHRSCDPWGGCRRKKTRQMPPALLFTIRFTLWCHSPPRTQTIITCSSCTSSSTTPAA